MNTILITGGNGEVGHALIRKLSEKSQNKIVVLDINDLDKKLLDYVSKFVKGSILDEKLIKNLFKKYNFDLVFHLAAILSTASEKNPTLAHRINVEGSINILKNAEYFARQSKHNLTLIFPSSIAVYGMPNLQTKFKAKKVKEWEYNLPRTLYGCNKLYIEILGNYYAKNYKNSKEEKQYFDFRSLRFPGIISAETMPTGGTSDYGPEILHAAAQKKDYVCFVKSNSTIPFMVMPDAIKALVTISVADKSSLKKTVYNVSSFSISAEEITQYAKKLIHPIKVTYKPDIKRQEIIDSWPISVDDSAAQEEWGWKPDFNKEDSFKKYLAPKIIAKYS